MTKIGLAHHYDLLWKESLQTIAREGFDYDPLLGSSLDNRFGITLLIRPSLRLMDAIQPFMEEIREIEPDHHFYPYSDIHVTVMPIISCYDGFRLERISPPERQRRIPLPCLIPSCEGNDTILLLLSYHISAVIPRIKITIAFQYY